MKIALIDLTHAIRGVHTNTVPLGLGLISTYLRKSIENDFDIKMFKLAERALKVFRSWVPDVLGLAQYSWNSELNLYISRLVKQINPDCLVVAGGPNLYLSKSRREAFLKREKSVDICVAFDGEIPFTEILRRLLYGETRQDIRKNPVAGSYSLDTENGRLFESLETIPRLKSLDKFGAVYANGVFEDMLNDGFHPFVQTHRGCPFTCIFCHTSDKYYSRMLFLSPDIFRQDMEYLGRRFAGNYNVTLNIANTNMSLFKEDFAIARIIREIQKKYNWPRIINVNSGKNPKNLLDMLSIINFRATLSLQTLTPNVLKNIRRSNPPFKDFVAFQDKISQKTKEISSTELICCLPGETKRTFLKTLRTVINSGIQRIVIYTLMNLKGTPLSSEESTQRYGYITRHRLVPRQFSLINGAKIFDTEEVIVGTNTMSYKDYLELRGLSFTVTVFFSCIELIPLKRFMRERDIDIAQWVFNIHAGMQNSSELNMCYKAFLKETEQELFQTNEVLVEFFDIPENCKKLCSGQLGDNLLRKYKCIILLRHYKTFLELAMSEARKIIGGRFYKSEVNSMLNDLETYISTRDMKQYYINCHADKNRHFHLSYDIPSWLQSNKDSLRLEDFHGSFDYIVELTDSAKRRFRDIAEINKDLELSLQILYRDGTIRDFWPVWVKSIIAKKRRYKTERSTK